MADPAGGIAADLLEGETLRDSAGRVLGVIEDVVIDIARGEAVSILVADAAAGSQRSIAWAPLARDEARGGYTIATLPTRR